MAVPACAPSPPRARSVTVQSDEQHETCCCCGADGARSGQPKEEAEEVNEARILVESKVFRGVKLQYSIKIAKIPVHAIRWFSSPKFCA